VLKIKFPPPSSPLRFLFFLLLFLLGMRFNYSISNMLLLGARRRARAREFFSELANYVQKRASEKMEDGGE
jgi:hypothetical protein